MAHQTSAVPSELTSPSYRLVANEGSALVAEKTVPHATATSIDVPSNTWSIVEADFPAQDKTVVRSMLSKFQWTNLNFHAPGTSVPGLGPALDKVSVQEVGDWGTVANDTFDTFALNYLYASGEAQRIVYEVAASSTNASHLRAEYFVKVPALQNQDLYRITYVPSILLLGLLALVGSSVVTGSMALYTRRSSSARAHRRLTVTRLLLDSVAGLQRHRDEVSQVAQTNNSQVDDWAATYKVRYNTRLDNVQGVVQIVLEKP
ncbi:hypothetical protein ACEQ8H_000487 [Pleosporales sp. CAS-2024a]